MTENSNMPSRWLLIDDQRTISSVERTARTFDDGFYAIHNEGPWDCIVFDHDLGDTEIPERTGYTLMCELERHPHLIPNNIMIITSNPSGRKRMEQLKNRLLELKHKGNDLPHSNKKPKKTVRSWFRNAPFNNDE